MEESARHLALLTRTIEVVNSSLDLQEVMEAIAHEVASALDHRRLLRLPLRRARGRAGAPRHARDAVESETPVPGCARARGSREPPQRSARP